jgi:hypothetical protein
LVILNFGAPRSRELIIEKHRACWSTIAHFFIAFENIDNFVIKTTLFQIIISRNNFFAFMIGLVFNQMLPKCFSIQFQLLSTLRCIFALTLILTMLFASILVI